MPQLHSILTQADLNGVYQLASSEELVPVLDGRTLSGQSGLLQAIGRALDFPDYYGGNWDALEECLGDLSWRNGPVWLVIRNANALPGEQLAPLLDIFAEAAGHWRRQGRVFSLFLAGLDRPDLPQAD